MKLRFMVDFSARPHLIKKATRGRTGCRVQPENPRVRPFIRRNERNMQKKKITAQLKKIDVDALNKVLTELPALMDTVNSLQTQVQNISNWFSSLGSVFGR